ncbi:hypothetical protein [Delftia sp. WSY_7]|uniref:hypothetical protein n=1 Tax=Delftia sp. WSY_7 TaxID=3367202 RepID=UPI00370CECDD
MTARRDLIAISCIALFFASSPAYAILGISIKIGPVVVNPLPMPWEPPIEPENQPLNITSHLIKAGEKEIGQISGNIIREAGIGYSNIERETRVGVSSVGTNLRKAAGDFERNLREAGGDVGRELKATQREVESATIAAYRFTVRQAESTFALVRQAEQRFREGKVIDAIWHLSTQQMQSTSDNAARAAAESAIVATAMSAAASAYGGPGGASAYSAWLAYYQTGGDVNAALRIGLIAAVKAYAPEIPGADLASTGIKESLKKAAVSGAMNGLAVAAAGGSAQDVQKAMMATAGTILVQDGYRSLSQNAAVAEFSKVARQVYCIKGLSEGSQDESCPSVNDYLRDTQGRFAMLDTSSIVRYVDMAKEIPGADWILLTKEEALAKSAAIAGVDYETLNAKMNEARLTANRVEEAANRVKGANILGMLDDRWALSYQAGKTVDGIRAAVAPSVLLTYTGISPAIVDKAAADPAKLSSILDAPLPNQPQEIVSCVRPAEPKANINILWGAVIEIPSRPELAVRLWVSKKKQPGDLECVVAQERDGKIRAAWYAKIEGDFCQPKMLEMTKQLIAENFNCSGR